MEKSTSVWHYFRRNRYLSFLTALYFLTHSVLAILIGYRMKLWQVVVPVLIMFVWITLFGIGFKILHRGGEGLLAYSFATMILLVFGSNVVTWKTLIYFNLLAGFILACCFWWGVIRIKGLLGFTPFIIYLMVSLLLYRLNSIKISDFIELTSMYFFVRNISIFFLILFVMHWVYKTQAKSIRNRVGLVLVFFGIAPFFLTLIILNVLVSRIQQPERIFSYTVWMAFLGGALMILAGIFVARWIFRPLLVLSKIVKKVDDGDFSISIDTDSIDEVGVIGRAINKLAENWRLSVTTLELRVTERTHNLERTNDQLQLAVEIAREITSMREMDELLNRSVRILSEKFGFDHVLLYLVDDRNEKVVLSSVAGYKADELLGKGIQIRIGNPDPVGTVASNGQPRLVNDVAIQAFHQYLTQTQSRMILPLGAGAGLLGVLDIHSDQPDTFTEGSVPLLKVITDQLAAAIENANLITKLASSIRELESLTGRFTYESWKNAQKALDLQEGYVYRGSVLRRRDTKPFVGITDESESHSSNLALPLMVRGQMIGSIIFEFTDVDPDPNIIATLKEMTQRLALIMENARLIMEARNVAAREQQINQITSQVRNSVNVESILRNTVQELGKAFGSSRTFIQIGFMPELSEGNSNNIFERSDL